MESWIDAVWNYSDELTFIKAMFEEGGAIKPWTATGRLVPLPPYWTDDDEGTMEWYVHLGGGMPGIFELARFDDAALPNVPTVVEYFEFSGHVIGPLPLVEYSASTDYEHPPPKQRFRFWPGKCTELMPV